MPVSIKLDAIFDKTKRDRAASGAVKKAAKRFTVYVPDQQKKSKATGKIRRRGSGRGFTHSHRASAKGQRPAIDSGKLLRGTKDKVISQFVVEVTTIAKREGFDYADHLQNKMDRPIQDAPEDLKAAQRMLDEEGEKAMRSL